MTDQPDYRLYLESEFRRVHDSLGEIKRQTTKTNNRVTHLEERVVQLDEQLIQHPINCTQALKIDKIKDDLEEYRVFKKYPKIGIVIIAIFTILLVVAAYGTFQTVHNTKANADTEKTVDTINENTR